MREFVKGKYGGYQGLRMAGRQPRVYAILLAREAFGNGFGRSNDDLADLSGGEVIHDDE